MHGDKPNINLNILIQNEGFGVQIPPISTLIFDKIANQLVKGDFQMVLYKFTNVNNWAKGLLEVFITATFDCVKRFDHLRIHDEFADLVHLGLRFVLVIWTYDPPFAISISSPACTDDGRFHALAFHKPLNHTNLIPCA